uniref:Xaa-Pro dipeptidyl-peptidase C-terminal domain-containing protein n=1 Tax=Eutreptiella gymnastica TaxID=73025 RepID=A0A7S1NLQ9_9EUGL|mmetsp:Transcript_49162/g.87745  ORF Transcript_49162/g.87745 Transcript_49162/m.87745 type:complete len:760 (+) Transcript_49162:46-2325(+)
MAIDAQILSKLMGVAIPDCKFRKEEVLMPMRDGVQLAATVLIPQQKGRKDKVDKDKDKVTDTVRTAQGIQTTRDTDTGPSSSCDPSSTPQVQSRLFPTILIRTPYHKKHMFQIAKWFVSHGYIVVVQDVRGRCGSDGEWDPVTTDEQDGHDTVRWVRRQDWFQQCPYVGTWGPSFLGIVQWAMLSTEDALEQPDAMVPIMSASRMHPILRPNNGISLALLVRWHYMTNFIRNETNQLDMMKLMLHKMDSKCSKCWDTSFLEVDRLITGKGETSRLGSYLVEHVHESPDSSFWRARDMSRKLPHAPPTHLLGGWYDFFLQEVLHDYTALRDAGRNPFLTIGPWCHFDIPPLLIGLKISLAWFDFHLKKKIDGCHSPTVRQAFSGSPVQSPSKDCGRQPGDDIATSPMSSSSQELDVNSPNSPTDDSQWDQIDDKDLQVQGSAETYTADDMLKRLPVKIYVMGSNTWKQFSSWPPPSSVTSCYLSANSLQPEASFVSEVPTTFVYDQNKPTPCVGGDQFHLRLAGRRKLNNYQKRSDVVAFTSPALAKDVEIIGHVKLTLHFRSDQEEPDFFVRLCVVGKKMAMVPKNVANVADGYLRAVMAEGEHLEDGIRKVVIDLGGTAQCWKAGQKIRLLISSGAHPRYMANRPEKGSGVPRRKVKQEIFHDHRYPSTLDLPVTIGHPFSPMSGVDLTKNRALLPLSDASLGIDSNNHSLGNSSTITENIASTPDGDQSPKNPSARLWKTFKKKSSALLNRSISGPT